MWSDLGDREVEDGKMITYVISKAAPENVNEGRHLVKFIVLSAGSC